MIAYSLLEWPYTRELDGRDPVWVSHPVGEFAGALAYSFPSITHASSVTVLVKNKVAVIKKAPNSLPSWRDLKVENFESFIEKSVNITSDVQEFLKGANPANAPKRISVCYAQQSDFKYELTGELKNFISSVKSVGQKDKGIVGNVVTQKQIEECKDCNG